MKHIKFRRLKIVEQIAIVTFLSVLIPMVISGFIINNISQQSLRAQLKESVVLIANAISEEANYFISQNKLSLDQAAYTINYIPTKTEQDKFFKTFCEKLNGCEKISLLKYQSDLDKLIQQNQENQKITINKKTENGNYIAITYNKDNLQAQLFHSLNMRSLDKSIFKIKHNLFL